MPSRHTIAPGTRDALMHFEYGSWEDHGSPTEPVHVYPIIERLKTRIRIDSVEEARIVLESIRYWSDAEGMDSWTPAFGRACVRLVGEIEAAWFQTDEGADDDTESRRKPNGKITYEIDLPDGGVATRTTKREYSHAVICYSVDCNDDEPTWGVIGFCGRRDLAQKQFDKYKDEDWILDIKIVETS